MASKALTCPTVLRQLLRYDPETGSLFYRTAPEWLFRAGPKLSASKRCSKWNKRNAGKRAFNIAHPVGYRCGNLIGKRIYAHRIAWAVFHGEWPAYEVDHINGDRADNRICNLRSVTRAVNTRNRFMTSQNTSGYCGVAWRKDIGKWRASIGVNGKTKHIGVYDNLADALSARREAEIEHGFSERHGLPEQDFN